jgi:small subunit ribosomal protein S21|uniref:Small ribosomal subunit protein bS21 n=1 Tax=candidate division WOR-3 bacterium TaxID=2052148 RepID=A0A7V5XZS9_UNCW3
MTKIEVRDGEPFESFIRRFRRAVEKAGILQDIKRKEFYEKPSERKKKRLAEAIRRWRKKMQQM